MRPHGLSRTVDRKPCKRVVAKTEARAYVFFPVFCSALPTSKVKLRAIAQLGATFSTSIPYTGHGCDSGIIRVDWYRMPILDRRWDELEGSLRHFGFHHGPYYGIGNVHLVGTGAGEDTRGHKAAVAKRKLVRTVVRANRIPWIKILKFPIGPDWPTVLGQETSSLPLPGDRCPESWADGYGQWNTLCSRFPLFAETWYHIDRQLFADGTDRKWAERAVYLIRWAREQLAGEQLIPVADSVHQEVDRNKSGTARDEKQVYRGSRRDGAVYPSDGTLASNRHNGCPHGTPTIEEQRAWEAIMAYAAFDWCI